MQVNILLILLTWFIQHAVATKRTLEEFASSSASNLITQNLDSKRIRLEEVTKRESFVDFAERRSTALGVTFEIHPESSTQIEEKSLDFKFFQKLHEDAYMEQAEMLFSGSPFETFCDRLGLIKVVDASGCWLPLNTYNDNLRNNFVQFVVAKTIIMQANKVLTRFLASGFNPNWLGQHGGLDLALYSCNTDTMKLLLAAGASAPTYSFLLNESIEFGILGKALELKLTEILEVFLRFGMNLFKTDVQHFSTWIQRKRLLLSKALFSSNYPSLQVMFGIEGFIDVVLLSNFEALYFALLPSFKNHQNLPYTDPKDSTFDFFVGFVKQKLGLEGIKKLLRPRTIPLLLEATHVDKINTGTLFLKPLCKFLETKLFQLPSSDIFSASYFYPEYLPIFKAINFDVNTVDNSGRNALLYCLKMRPFSLTQKCFDLIAPETSDFGIVSQQGETVISVVLEKIIKTSYPNIFEYWNDLKIQSNITSQLLFVHSAPHRVMHRIDNCTETMIDSFGQNWLSIQNQPFLISELQTWLRLSNADHLYPTIMKLQQQVIHDKMFMDLFLETVTGYKSHMKSTQSNPYWSPLLGFWAEMSSMKRFFYRDFILKAFHIDLNNILA